MPERRIEGARRDTLERVKQAVAGRIGRVCSHLDTAEFDALVTRMALVEIKYGVRAADDWPA
jgi:hypothetical protein